MRQSSGTCSSRLMNTSTELQELTAAMPDLHGRHSFLSWRANSITYPVSRYLKARHLRQDLESGINPKDLMTLRLLLGGSSALIKKNYFTRCYSNHPLLERFPWHSPVSNYIDPTNSSATGSLGQIRCKQEPQAAHLRQFNLW